MENPKFQKLIDELIVLNIQNDKELIRVINEKLTAMFPNTLDCENRILAELLAIEVRCGGKSKIVNQAELSSDYNYQSYLWMPVHPDFMLNKPKEPIPLIACLLEQTAQELLNNIKSDIKRNDLQSAPSQISLNYLLEFASSQGYSCVRLIEVGEDIPISNTN